MKRYTASDFQAAMHGQDPRRAELAHLEACIGPPAGLLAQSQPSTGMVLTEQGPMDVVDALQTLAIGKVVYRFGTWAVTEGRIACLVHAFPLSHAQLQENPDWPSHLAEQPWVNLWDALRALRVAIHVRAQRPPDGSQGDAARPS